MELTPAGAGPSAEVAEDGTVTNREHFVKSKILSHFYQREDLPDTYGDCYDDSG